MTIQITFPNELLVAVGEDRPQFTERVLMYTLGQLYQQGDIQSYLLQRLAQCRLPHQPNKVRHEPRKVRRKPAVFPPLKDDRNIARQEISDHFAQLANS